MLKRINLQRDDHNTQKQKKKGQIDMFGGYSSSSSTKRNTHKSISEAKETMKKKRDSV